MYGGVVFAKSLDDPDTGYALTADEIRDDITQGRAANQQVDSQGGARSRGPQGCPRVRQLRGWRSRAETQRALRRRMREMPSRGSCMTCKACTRPRRPSPPS